MALTGSRFAASVDGRSLPPFEAREIPGGSTLRIGDGDGARAYLAIAGGMVVETLLGSAATDLRSGFGGHEGRALRAGDVLAVRTRHGRRATLDGRIAAGTRSGSSTARMPNASPPMR